MTRINSIVERYERVRVSTIQNYHLNHMEVGLPDGKTTSIPTIAVGGSLKAANAEKSLFYLLDKKGSKRGQMQIYSDGTADLEADVPENDKFFTKAPVTSERFNLKGSLVDKVTGEKVGYEEAKKNPAQYAVSFQRSKGKALTKVNAPDGNEKKLTYYGGGWFPLKHLTNDTCLFGLSFKVL